MRDHLELGRGYLLLLDATLLWRYVSHLLLPLQLSVLYDPPTAGIDLCQVGRPTLTVGPRSRRLTGSVS